MEAATLSARPGQVLQRIIESVSAYYNISVADLTGKRRPNHIAFPRQVSMYLARRHTRYSLEEIGCRIGYRDHSTVCHAVQRVAAGVATDPIIAEQIRQLESRLEAAA